MDQSFATVLDKFPATSLSEPERAPRSEFLPVPQLDCIAARAGYPIYGFLVPELRGPDRDVDMFSAAEAFRDLAVARQE